MVGRSTRPPLLPCQAIRVPCRHRHRKKQHGPIQGDKKKNIHAGQTAGTLAHQHPTPLGAPHTTHYALLRVSHPTRAPEGQNPKRPQPHQGNPVRPPFYIATRPATTQAASRHLNRRHRQMAERNFTPGGPPVNAAERRTSPPPVESTTCRGSSSSREPQCPFALLGSEDPAGREPPIADECGRHSDLLMDWAGTTFGTIAKPTGWHL